MFNFSEIIISVLQRKVLSCQSKELGNGSDDNSDSGYGDEMEMVGRETDKQIDKKELETVKEQREGQSKARETLEELLLTEFIVR
ncbi:hypothetical protein GQX74_001360 [Glossina fuscipes]|nr:hypothetical protein GQX74_001360 [Glossina fuscipes]